MSYLEKLAGEPIVIRVLEADVQSEENQRAGLNATLELLTAQPDPVFLILDMSSPTFPNTLDSLMSGTNMAARQLHLFQHPKVRETLFITTNPLFELAAKGLDSDVYGHVKIRVVATRDEALAYIRSVK